MSENKTLSFIFMAMLVLLSAGCEADENVKDRKETIQPPNEMPLTPFRNLMHLEIQNTPSPSLEPILSTITADVKNVEIDDKPTEVKEENNDNIKILEVTAYTNNRESTGKKPGDKYYGVTASGQKTKEGVTIACPKSMPFGTQIYIPYFDNTYTCTDRGGAIKEGRLDVFMSSESKAIKFGRRKLEVQIIEKKGE